MNRYFLSHIARMDGYVPGEQPRNGGFIKLNTNENPYPPSPRVIEAIAGALNDRLRLYPDPVGTAFRQVAARRHGVDPDMVLVGNGSDDLLTILTRAFVGPGDLAVYPTPSYILYKTLLELQDAARSGSPIHAWMGSRSRHLRHPRRAARLPGQPQQPLGHVAPPRGDRRAGRAARLPVGRR